MSAALRAAPAVRRVASIIADRPRAAGPGGEPYFFLGPKRGMLERRFPRGSCCRRQLTSFARLRHCVQRTSANEARRSNTGSLTVKNITSFRSSLRSLATRRVSRALRPRARGLRRWQAA